MVLGLVSTRMKMTKAKKALLKEGDLQIPVTKISYKGCPAWRSLGNQGDLIEQWIAELHDRPEPPAKRVRTAPSLHLGCPNCAQFREAANLTLFCTDGKMYSTVYCFKCKRTTVSKKWTCACKVPWFTCPYHSEIGFSLNNDRTPKAKPIENNSSSRIRAPKRGMPSDANFVPLSVCNSAISVASLDLPTDGQTTTNTNKKNRASSLPAGGGRLTGRAKKRAADEEAIASVNRMRLSRSSQLDFG